MTELEKMLKDTLTHMEQDFSAIPAGRGKTLEEQQRALTAHSQGSLYANMQHQARRKKRLQYLPPCI